VNEVHFLPIVTKKFQSFKVSKQTIKTPGIACIIIKLQASPDISYNELIAVVVAHLDVEKWYVETEHADFQ
jgi:hypothetical protein